MSSSKKIMDEIKKEAEKKMGMSWGEIMKQADNDTKKQQQKKDPISQAFKESSKSPKKMFNESMDKLKKNNKG